MILSNKFPITFLVLFFFGSVLFAQKKNPEPYQPNRQEMLERYRKAQLLDSAIKNKVFKTNVHAHWQKNGNTFWYCNVLKDSVREYMYVDVARGTKQKAFNLEKLAVELGKALGKPLQAKHFVTDSIIFEKSAREISFKFASEYFHCNLADYSCNKIKTLPTDTTHYPVFLHQWERWNAFGTDSISPDKQWAAFIKDGNLFIQPVTGGTAVQFTKNGTLEKPYGALAWSPDSKYIVGYNINPVTDSFVYHVLSSIPNTTRGQLRSIPYKQPGDPFTSYEMYVFDIAAQKTRKVNTPLIDFFEPPELHWRNTDKNYFSFERVERGHQRFRIIEVNAATGDSHAIVDEQTKTFIYEGRLFTHYLPVTNEIILTSEKDGWRHIYLTDAITGKEKRQVTKGDWVVRSVDSIDKKKREIWFTASGVTPGEDPYFIHYYRIGFDAKNLISLTQSKGNHQVVFSPDKKYYVDTYSQVNVPTVIELHRTSDAKKIMELEKADATEYLATGMPLPEPFHAKGRDGTTDIWGVVCRPADFDSTKRYPVIENIYAGPQDAFVPKSFMGWYGEMQSIAQLGFIVVQIDGMGTANRSKAFHDVCWHNLADAGFADRILWIKALADKYAYVDTERVGLYGTSAGGQNALGGLLFQPRFYKAAVSACGCHDNRIDKQWWNEQWMGYPVGKHYDEQSNVTNAYKLQGSLLLIVGEADENVPPESTYRVADALIKAGKTFDFLPIPGSNHTDGGPYGRIRKRDFFVQHLLGVLPPQRNNDELSIGN